MDGPSEGSVSHWIQDLKQGDSLAAQQLWNRYFSQLVRVALNRLRGMSQVEAAEDIALSALKSVMIGIEEDRYPLLADRDSLWPLLVTITARKSITEMRRQLAQKRSINMEVQQSDIQEFIGENPTPAFAMEVADELERLVLKLNDPTLRIIVERKLDGVSHEDLAKELGCSPRTVIRKLNRIRQEWEESDGGATSVEESHKKV
jgi:RNA polymerase sigma factor (sigma-70 family)